MPTLAINFLGVSMHFSHQCGQKHEYDWKPGRFFDFGAIWTTLCALLSVEFGRGRLVPINIFNKNSHNLSYTLFRTKKLETLGLLTNLYFAPSLFWSPMLGLNIFLPTPVLRKWNGLCLLQDAISSHQWLKVTSGLKWPWLRGLAIVLTPNTIELS